MCYITDYCSPLGRLYIISDGTYLIRLIFGSDGELDNSYGEYNPDLPVFDEIRNWLDTYFSGNAPAFTPPLSMDGTDFQKEVWDILLEIPQGQTMRYGEIAKRIEDRRGMHRMSAQAVGNAVAKNPIPIIVPCHRVIGSDGSLTGYAGGLDKKLFLLSSENIAVKNSADT